MIDILLATYNGQKFIKQQLDSIIRQKYLDWRLIIHDDGSTDNTVEIINAMMKKDERIRIIDDGIIYRSAKKNFLHLIYQSSAEYCMLCDQDDVWECDKISILYQKMKNTERVSCGRPVLIFSDAALIDENNVILYPSLWEYQKINYNSSIMQIPYENCVTGCTTIFNHALVSLIIKTPKERWDEIIMHDWYIAIIAYAEGIVGRISGKLVRYRQHSVNVVGANSYMFTGIIRKLFTLPNTISRVKQLSREILVQNCLVNTIVNKENRIPHQQTSINYTDRARLKIRRLFCGMYHSRSVIKYLAKILYY